jgi:alpha-amylase
LNTDCTIYKEIAKIAAVVQARDELRFGRMYFRPISGDGVNFGLPFGTTYTLAFARILYGREVLVAYNVSADARTDAVVVDASLHPTGSTMTFLYGKTGTVPVEDSNGTRFVRLDLAGHQFAILV